jgi:hypothetical protein
MSYDEVFRKFTESSPFSSVGKFSVNDTEYTIGGIFCSGNYGEQDYDRGYTTKKTEPRQSFKISLQSLPTGVASSDLVRQKLTVNGKNWIVRDVVGNDSGILSLDLVPMGENT